MADLKRYPDEVWDRFFDFASRCDEELPLADLDEDLSRMGIDVQKAINRVQQALATAKAKADLKAAKAARPRILARFGQITAQAGGSLRERLRSLIEGLSHGTRQAAYFKKLETAATEEDLQSLLEDMCRLEALEEEQDDAESGTK